MSAHNRKIHQYPRQKFERPATKDFACEACGKLFYFEGNLMKHMRTLHEGIKQQKEHICDSCGKAFYHAGILKNHIGRCGEEAQIDVKCEKCDRMFKNNKLKKIHIRYFHMEGVKNFFICDYCGKKFPNKSYLKVHKDTIHQENPNQHTCEECGKGFYGKHNLRKHIRTVHQGQKDYKCEFCGNLFSLLHSMQRHIRKFF